MYNIFESIHTFFFENMCLSQLDYLVQGMPWHINPLDISLSPTNTYLMMGKEIGQKFSLISVEVKFNTMIIKHLYRRGRWGINWGFSAVRSNTTFGNCYGQLLWRKWPSYMWPYTTNEQESSPLFIFTFLHICREYAVRIKITHQWLSYNIHKQRYG